MAQIYGVSGCCGIKEIASISGDGSAPKSMRTFCTLTVDKTSEHFRFRYGFFSQARRESNYGERFAAFILKNKLGEVVETGFNVNPNSGNPLKVFVWTIDWTALAKWRKADVAAKEID